MRVTRQDHARVQIATVEERPLKVGEPPVKMVDRIANPKSQVGRHLIVPAPTRMQLATRVIETANERRFDVHLNDGKHLVIDDYAHNPHKIASLTDAAKRISKKICYIFQPHGYGPTRLMKEGYIATFIQNLREGDHLFLLPVYYAGGTSVKDISSEDLSREIASAGKSSLVLQTRSVLFDRLKEWKTYIVLGARDESLSDFAREIAGRLR
jgi:UDP-N-acetylmuramate-alanine ligase